MLKTISLFLLHMLFDLYIYVVILRLLLQMIHADFFNPLAQFAIRFTQPLVHPLQKILPEVKRVDLAVIVLLLLLEIVKELVMYRLQLQHFPSVGGLLLLTLAELMKKFLTFYFYAILFRTVMSFVSPSHHNPVYFALSQLVEPILRPARRLMPLVKGYDLSPFMVLIVLQILLVAVAMPLLRWASV